MKTRSRMPDISRIDQPAKHNHGYFVRLQQKFGPPARKPRRWWAEIPRRKGRSGIVGVQRTVLRRPGRVRKYWMATWSPEPYMAVRKLFSIFKHGERKAKSLAIPRPAGWIAAHEMNRPDGRTIKSNALKRLQTEAAAELAALLTAILDRAFKERIMIYGERLAKTNNRHFPD